MKFSAISAIFFTLAVPAIARPFPQQDSNAITARDIAGTDGDAALFQVTRRDDAHTDSADFDFGSADDEADSDLTKRGKFKPPGRHTKNILDQKNKEGKADVKWIANDPKAPMGAKDLIKQDYKQDTGKDPNTINKVKFSDGYNPDAAKAQKAAMEKAGKKEGKHVFTPGSPGWDELKNSPLYKLGNKVQAGKGEPQRVKINHMDSTGGADMSMDWRTPEQRAADKAKKAGGK
ncbi:hypothetical protein MAPG_08985 [Magnaporthiopsis poae ATCC 64411]|uniref:Uncharacterized protein n=1 Tax=Magnaporthiopsis poae (strain ATCC 64411 / 73-15) TaxID=644358 RepID=A0A0C4E8R7_MAGP6|nr:hypothetical protein MAPG_08985 [Magnaporthiopsis poae ATCC 64411]